MGIALSERYYALYGIRRLAIPVT